MKRFDTYFGQLVDDGDIDGWFDEAEQADRNIVADLGFLGVMAGLVVSEHSPNNLTVDVTGGTAYDPDGQRIKVTAGQVVDLSVDHLSASTAVAGVGKTKIVSLFVKFQRSLSQPENDDNGVPVYTVRDESFTFYVVQGAESSGTPTPPSLEADGILLADITRSYGVTTITTANISTARRQDLVAFSGTTIAFSSNSHGAAISTLAQILDDHVSGADYIHPASDITTTALGNWANADAADAIGVGSAQTSLAAIVSKLAATTASHSGGHLVGVATITDAGGGTISGGTMHSVLTALKAATNIYYAGSGNWANADAADAIAAGTVAASLSAVVSKLAATTASHSGGHFIGMATNGNFTGGTLYSFFTQLGQTGAGDDGAKRVGLEALGNFSAGTVRSAFGELVATTSSNDGAKKVGAQASGNLLAGTVRSQLDELDTAKAALAGATFTGKVTVPQVVTSGVLSIGVIAANTQIANDVALVLCQPGASNSSNWNIAMPTPASGYPEIDFMFTAFAGTGRRVWITDTANLSTSSPSDYFAYWDASAANARLRMKWDGTRWRVLSHISMSGTTGGGTLAD